MNSPASGIANSRIRSVTLHQIDVDKHECKEIKITTTGSDLEGYLSDLLEEVNEKEQKRAYKFVRTSTEFHTVLCSYISTDDLTKNPLSGEFAERLLEKEIITEKRYGHLGSKGKGIVKKGSYLQFLYDDSGATSYLGVKIEHQTFIDEKDFKKRIGLSVVNKMYKACRVLFDNGVPGDVHVYDTNSKPSVYWWSDFLELSQVRDDAYNTKTASDEVIKAIGRLKKRYPADHTVLKNSVIGAFKQSGNFKYDEFVDEVIKDYKSDDSKLNAYIPKLVDMLKSLPDKKDFDTAFKLVPSEVSYRKTKYVMSKEIEVVIEDGIDDLDDKIWAEKTASGKKLVVIESPEGFDRFTEKVRS